GIALLGDYRCFPAGEIRYLRTTRLAHADDHRPRVDWAKDDIRAFVDGFLAHRFCDGRIGLGVGRNVVDLAAEDAAGSIDLLDRELDAVVEIVARRGAGPGQLHDPVKQYRALLRHRAERDTGENGKS